MFHVEHFSAHGLIFDCGKMAVFARQLSKLARKSVVLTSAPKSVIAIGRRLELFCELALGSSAKIKWDAFSL